MVVVMIGVERVRIERVVGWLRAERAVCTSCALIVIASAVCMLCIILQSKKYALFTLVVLTSL